MKNSLWLIRLFRHWTLPAVDNFRQWFERTTLVFLNISNAFQGMYFGQFSIIYLLLLVLNYAVWFWGGFDLTKTLSTCFWAKNWGSQTICHTQIRLWRFGWLICGWGLGFGVLGFWAWDEFWGRIVTDSDPPQRTHTMTTMIQYKPLDRVDTPG